MKHINGWSYYFIPELERRGIRHGFFTAQSPSHMLYGDEKTRFLKALELKDLIVLRQEHKDEVHVIAGGIKPASGDGLILLEKGVAGVVKTADCLPVIVCDADYPVVSIIHAGWRGTAKRIVANAIEKMLHLGVKREKLSAILGPSIGSCCYEVKEDIRDIFTEAGFSAGIFKHKNNALFLDIRQANAQMLKNEGIDDIFDINICTRCSNGVFHSYRGGEKEKRQINFVSISV